MKKEVKTKVKTKVCNLICKAAEKVAFGSEDYACLWWQYQPKVPDALKNIKNDKTTE